MTETNFYSGFIVVRPGLFSHISLNWWVFCIYAGKLEHSHIYIILFVSGYPGVNFGLLKAKLLTHFCTGQRYPSGTSGLWGLQIY